MRIQEEPMLSVAITTLMESLLEFVNTARLIEPGIVNQLKCHLGVVLQHAVNVDVHVRPVIDALREFFFTAHQIGLQLSKAIAVFFETLHFCGAHDPA